MKTSWPSVQCPGGSPPVYYGGGWRCFGVLPPGLGAGGVSREQARAAAFLAAAVGGVAGSKLWPAHPVLGAILGWYVGANAAGLVTGVGPLG